MINLGKPRVTSSEDDSPKELETEIQLPNISRKLRRKYFIPKRARFSERVNKLIRQ